MRARKKVVITILVLTALCFIIGCNQPAESAGKLTQEDVEGIKANLEAFVQSDLDGDWETFFSQFTEDVAWYWLQGEPSVEGLAAMKKLELVKALEKEIKIDVVDGRGDLGYARGTFSILLDHEGAVKINGNFLTIHRKQPDGSWRIAVNMPNY